MPSKNTELLAAIPTIREEIAKNTVKQQLAAENALNALLQGENTIAALNPALRAHNDFWGLLKVNPGTDDFLEDNAEQLKQLKQLAAEQRVILGLAHASNDVILGILKHNPDQCRDYLAQQASLGSLADSNGWPAPDPSKAAKVEEAKEAKEAILPLAAVENIQKEAARLQLEKVFQKASDETLLRNYYNALDGESIKSAASALGFPDDPQSLKTMLKIKDELNDLAEQRLFDVAFQNHLNKLTEADSVAVTTALTNVETYLKDKLKLETIPDGRVEKATQLLNERLLQFNVSTKDTLNVPAVEINGINDIAAMKFKINKVDGYEEGYVTDKTLPALKSALVTNLIRKSQAVKDSTALDAIASAKDQKAMIVALEKLGVTPAGWIDERAIKGFKRAAEESLKVIRSSETARIISRIETLNEPDSLANYAKIADLTEWRKIVGGRDTPRNGDWIGPEQMETIRKAACKQALLLKMVELDRGDVTQKKPIEETSIKASEARHAALLTAITSLGSIDDQLAFLNTKTKVQIAGKETEIEVSPLQQLMRAQRAENLPENLKGKGIVEENAQNLLYKKIHNPILAQILEKNKVAVTKTLVDSINGVLHTSALNSAHTAGALKGALHAVLDSTTNYDIRQLGDGASILTSNQKRKFLHEALQDATRSKNEVNEQLLPLLLSLSVPLQSRNRLPGMINEALLANSNADAFIRSFADKLITKGILKSDDETTFISEMKTQLSQHQYNKLIDSSRKNIATSLPEEQKTIEQNLDSELAALKTERTPFVAALAKLTTTLTEGKHEPSPSFDAVIETNPRQMREQYTALQEEQQLCLDVLTMQQARLEAIKKSMEGDGAAIWSSRTPIIGTSRVQQVDAQLRDLGEKITKCTTAVDNINLIVADITRVQAGEEHWVSSKSDSFISDEELNKLREEYKDNEKRKNKSLIIPETLTASDREGFTPELKKTTDTSQTHRLISIQVGAKDNTEVVETLLVAQINPPVSTLMSKTDEEIKRRKNWKLEMIKPPSSAKSGEVTSEPAALVGAYMKSAEEMIKAHGGLPTKDRPIYLKGGTKEQMELLWTALMISGEKQGMKPDALVVVTGTFNPQAVRGVMGYTKESKYKAVFKHLDAVTVLQQSLKEVQKVITDCEAKKQNQKSEDKSISSYKAVMEKGREAVAAAAKKRATEQPVSDPGPDLTM